MYKTEDVRKALILDKKFPRIITLCGSTKFKEDFLFHQKHLAQIGVIVLSVGWFAHAEDGEQPPQELKRDLDELHKRKIDISDEILVINVAGYIGESTQSEIRYALNNNIPVKYIEECLPEF